MDEKKFQQTPVAAAVESAVVEAENFQGNLRVTTPGGRFQGNRPGSTVLN